MFYTYILYSRSLDKYYIGSTEDIEKRLNRHNSGSTKSTKSGRPWGVVYTESFETRSDAVRRELEIKSKKSRIYIEKLIDSLVV